jgi:hypothetical protein
MPGDAAEAERARCSYVAGPPPRSGEVLARDAAGDGRVLVVNHAPNPAVVTLRTADGRLAARVFLNGGAQTELSGLPTQKLVESAAFGELWSRGCDRFLAGARAQLHRTPVNAGSAVAVEPDD